MREYSHVVIHKDPTKQLADYKAAIDEHGLRTAQASGIQLASGSMKLEHHLNVFLWDDTALGIAGRVGIESAGNCFTVKVRWKKLTQDGMILSGSLQGDNMHAGPPKGLSTNGAWAYKGDIPRRYLFIETVDSVTAPGFDKWVAGDGWG